MHIHTSINELTGIGKTRAEKLGKLGISTVGDLIHLYPRAYENRGDLARLGDYVFDSPRSYTLTVSGEVKNATLKNRLTMSKLRAFDDSGSVDVIFFNSPFVKDIFHVGSVFRFYGRLSFSKTKRLTLISPKYDPVIPGGVLPSLVPIYPLTDGITSKLIDKLIRSVLSDCLDEIEDPLPDHIRVNNGLSTLQYAIKNIHFPLDAQSLAKAQRRLAFDEMLFFALGISLSCGSRSHTSGVPFSPTSLTQFTTALPYELTPSQKAAINDVYRDTVLKKEDGKTPAMARIIIGDVGCGKTVCAAAAMYIAVRSGYQCALMVPTEILASQHYADINALMERLGIKTSLLTGSTSAKARRELLSQIESGETDVLVGTHALLSDNVRFSKLGLIVTDEQHRFGVAQRARLKDRTQEAHMLVMSATPIPRSLALALYGDLDISRITDMPKGRAVTETYLIDETYRKRLNDFIKRQVELGGQCYIICPSIDRAPEEEDYLIPQGIENTGLIRTANLQLKNTVEYTEELKKALPGMRIACLHGKMKNADKDATMRTFADGEIDVLVSTTVIEVGVNVPNATLMIVENAERFGLAQLHQLRGRVGRGTKKSYCILVSDVSAEKSRARLEALKSTHDGFEIAARDLALRGPGDFFSQNATNNIRQSGGFEFKLAKLCDDNTLFDLAFSTAKTITEADPTLSLPSHKLIREQLSELALSASIIS